MNKEQRPFSRRGFLLRAFKLGLAGVVGVSLSEDSGARKPGNFVSNKNVMPVLESDKKEFIDVGFDREVLEGSTIGEARKRS